MPDPAIADHGLIGDLQTAALVSTAGTIDWYCCPRFDSPAVFASLLDDGRGGYFELAPVRPAARSTQMYLPDTAVLVTRHLSDDGVAEVIDFMPIENPRTASPHRTIVRVIRGVRGTTAFRARVAPRFDYGRRPHRLTIDGQTAWFEAGEQRLRLSSVGPLSSDGDDVVADITVSAGEVAGFVLESGVTDGSPMPIGGGQILALHDATVAFWRGWLNRSTYRGRWREAVERSAITLKLLTYAPSGGLVAAPTAGLPEQVGGARNWDYRYTWVRDGSFSVYALLGLGFTEEAAAFGEWLRARLEESADGEVPLQIMYRVDGDPDIPEEVLDHLAGYRGSTPVRIGNAAADQLQLDIYGEAMSAIEALDGDALADWGVGPSGWSHIVRMIDWLCEHWQEPEEGIWETRGGRRRFTYGQLMSWVAFDRAIRMATDRGRPGNVARWSMERDRVHHQILSAGWNEDLRAFVQYEDSDVLDASLVLMPLMGFIPPNDAQWQSTLDAMRRTLVEDSLVYRYDPQASPDGLPGAEGTFSLCTFLFADALARSGHVDEARITFSKMLTYANHLGLYSEEIDNTGSQVGNFPQAFTHLSLIAAALNLDRFLDQPPGYRVPDARGASSHG